VSADSTSWRTRKSRLGARRRADHHQETGRVRRRRHAAHRAPSTRRTRRPLRHVHFAHDGDPSSTRTQTQPHRTPQPGRHLNTRPAETSVNDNPGQHRLRGHAEKPASPRALWWHHADRRRLTAARRCRRRDDRAEPWARMDRRGQPGEPDDPSPAPAGIGGPDGPAAQAPRQASDHQPRPRRGRRSARAVVADRGADASQVG